MPVTLAASEKDNFLASLATEPFGTQQNWYVAHTHIHAESKAAFHLQRQGFGIYLPRYLKKRRHARRVDTVAAPLSPRYLFVCVVMPWARARPIGWPVGLRGFEGEGNFPAIVPPAVIDGLKR